MAEREAKTKKKCLVNVDMDNLSDYARVYAIKNVPIDNDVLYSNVVPRLLDLFSRYDIKATFFIVGRDCGSERNRRAVRKISEEGHEVANHTLTHTAFNGLSGKEKRFEIEEADKILSDILGKPVAGFRPPHLDFKLDKESIDILEENGYLYDSSLCPAFLYLFAERTVLYLRSKRTIKGLRPTISDIQACFAKDRIYKIEGSTLFEIPTTVLPLFRTPFLATLTMASGNNLYFDLGYPLVKRFVEIPVFRLHGMDLLGLEEDALDGSFHVHPGMKQPLSRKTDKFRHIFGSMSKDYEFVTAESVIAKGGPAGN
jgi:hypothetical protein